MKKISFRTEEQLLSALKQENLYNKFQSMHPRGQKLFLDFCTGKSLRALTYDAIFKKIFNFEQHPKRLEHFLSAVLGFSVTILKVLPVESERIVEAGSIMIMDIVVMSEDGSIINVEMQRCAYKFNGQRDSCYISDLIMRQYNEKKAKVKETENAVFSYNLMKPVYSIIILEKSYGDMLNFKNTWEHTAHMTFDSGLQMNFLENVKYLLLDNFKKILENRVKQQENLSDTTDSIKTYLVTEKEQWAYLLSASSAQEIFHAASISDEMFEIVSDIAEFVIDTGQVMNMFSEALYMMDRGTEKLMYDEAIENLGKAQKQLQEQTQKLKETKKKIEESERKIEESERKIEESERKIEESERKALEATKRADNSELETKVLKLLLHGDNISHIIEQTNVSKDYIAKLKREYNI